MQVQTEEQFARLSLNNFRRAEGCMQANRDTWRFAVSLSIRYFGRAADSTRAFGGLAAQKYFRKVKNSLVSLWNFS